MFSFSDIHYIGWTFGVVVKKKKWASREMDVAFLA